MTSSSQTPSLNLVLDIDGTLIGDISLFTISYNVIKALPKNTRILNRLKTNIIYALKNGLMRPHLPQFLKSAKKQYNLKLYIYTASSYDWAHFLVPCLEKALGVKFQRPLYTRNECTSYTMLKNLEYVTKHAGDKIPMVMIDNNKTLYRNVDKSRLIKCPTYNFRYYYNPISVFTYSEIVSNFKTIMKVLKDLNIFIKAKTAEDLYRYCQDVTMDYFMKMPLSDVSDKFFSQKSINKKLLKMLK